MYQQYFGLVEAPFSIAVNPRYLFMSARHRDALAHLLYGVGSGGGFIMLTGEVGTGKTTLNRCLLQQLPPNTDIAIVLNPALSAVELLATVCDEFEIDYPIGTDSLKILTDALHQFLLRNHQSDRRTVLMIDEAQHLGFEVLEQIRLLTNLETDERKLLQIILTGQPELASMLARPELRQLKQRITARFDLTPLDEQETRAYVRHRLQVAGLSDDQEIFSGAALRQIFRLSGGVPRVINLLCDRAMMGAYGRDQATVSPNLVAEAAKETFGGESAPRTVDSTPWPSRATARGAMLGVLLAAAVAAAVLWVGQTERFSGNDAVRPSAMDSTDQQASTESQKPAATATATVVSGVPWILDQERADLALWSLWSGQALVRDLCEQAPDAGLQCARSDADTWNAVLANNRPAVLDIRQPDGFAGKALLVGMSDAVALLGVSAGRSVCQIPLASLAIYWRGGLSYLWKSPRGWVGPLTEGDQGSVVTQIVADFSRLDGLPPPPLDVFTPALTERVRQFQQSVGLEVDGVIGVQTLQALNDALGVSPTLAITLERSQPVGEMPACL
jgi:general secretion pathway protein A